MNKRNSDSKNGTSGKVSHGAASGRLGSLVITAILAGAFFSAGFIYSSLPGGTLKPSTPPTAKAPAAMPEEEKIGVPAAESQSQLTQEVNRSTPTTPSPMDRPSADELKRFPGAKLKEAVEVPGPGDDQVTRIRILDTNFKYPFIRTEEIVNPATGQLVSREEMVADHILVTLAEGEDPLALVTSFGADALAMERVTPDVPLYRLHLSSASAQALPKALEVAAGTTSVLVAEPDFIVQANLSPNDPRFLDNSLWGLHQSNDVDIDAPEAWDVRSNAGSVLVAVIDTGIRYSHEDLAANMWRNPREIPGNRIDDDGNGVVDDVYGMDACNNDGDPMDDQGHGTHCAGTIGGVGNNGRGVAGVAWQVKLMACKFLSSSGSGTSSDAIRCIDYARANGAKIMSNSWGGGGPSASLLAAIERARSAGILFVAAAGNDGRDTDQGANYPSCYASDNIVSVAATDRNDSLAYFSNYGAMSVDLGAPGVGILSTVSASDSSYASYSGTSMATPHVAGALAVLAAQFPSENYAGLIRRLLAAADPIPALRGRTVSGGRLNLARALRGSVPTPPPPSAPTNDNFASALPLGSSSWAVTGQNLNGTAEAGEPAHAGNTASKSVWWIWTAPLTGSCTLQTTGSSFDTVLAVYTGDALNRLTPVVSNDNANAGITTSLVSFPVIQGITYRFAVDGKLGASGNINLSCQAVPARPANDNFAAAASLAGNTFQATGSNLSATSEMGEPNHAWVSGRQSVWWTWTAPASGVVTLSTLGSGYDTTLAVYSGNAVNALSQVAANDDDPQGQNYSSRVDFRAVAGTVYRIAVDGYAGATGSIRLAGNLTVQQPLGVPANVQGVRESSGQITVSWSAVSQAVAYDVVLAQGSRVYAAGRVSGTRARTVSSMPSGLSLTVQVRAVDAAGRTGAWSTATPVR